jgi:sodium transport system permease protein
MTLNFSTVAALFSTELRMVLRDRRMVVTSILLPLLVTPLTFLGSTWSLKKREHQLQAMVYRYAITGPEAAEARRLLKRVREQQAPAAPTRQAAGPKQDSFHFQEAPSDDSLAALDRGDVQFVIEAFQPESGEPPPRLPKTPSRAKASRSSQSSLGETNMPGALALRFIYRGDRDESSAGMARMSDALRETRRSDRTEMLRERGFTLLPARVASVTQRDLATKGQAAGLFLGRSLTLLLVFFILTAGAVVAIDSLAGEKERGTLETLLTTSATRMEILTAKQLVILAVALMITLIQSANLLVYAGFKVLPLPPDLAAAVPPRIAVLLFLMYIPVAALLANVLLLISGYARSYKEAQLYFMPALLLGLVPALAPFLPGVPLRSAIILVPVANTALAVKEILTGTFDWPMIVSSWLVTAGGAVWTVRKGARTLVNERLITSAETNAAELRGGPALFEHRVERWFLVLWAALLLLSNYAERLDLRLQVTLNVVVLLCGASCLMIWRYRLNPRRALALRAPHPATWLGLVPAIPGGALTAAALFHLTSRFLPASTKMEEAFNQALFTAHLPWAQLILFLCVMPGVFEEITFRGMLLYGLRRRLHPVALALVVGLTFGVFHVTLFRLLPTAALGVMLAAVTLLTGSIFPAMIWHAVNNAAAIWIFKLQIPEGDLDAVCYWAGAGLLTVAFWVFWRHRTPYPELRRTPIG